MVGDGGGVEMTESEGVCGAGAAGICAEARLMTGNAAGSAMGAGVGSTGAGAAIGATGSAAGEVGAGAGSA